MKREPQIPAVTKAVYDAVLSDLVKHGAAITMTHVPVKDVYVSPAKPRYVPADITNIRELFARIDPNWNKRPAHLEPRAQVRNSINGWD